MIIKNGLVFTENASFQQKDLHISNHKIVDSCTDGELYDATGQYVIPGLIDLHIHGAMGSDFSDGSVDGLRRISSYLYQHGITSFCPTSMSYPEDTLTHIFTSATVQTPPCSSHIVGVHMEGPFLSQTKKGAQNGDFLCSPNIPMFQRLYNQFGPMIKFVTLAPELDNAFEFIKRFHNVIHISLGHTAATYETATQALSLGSNHITHLFNGMLPLHHRNPGLIAAAMEHSNTTVELICDGFHVHPAMIRMALQLFGDHRVIFISDSTRATGMPNGSYTLGGQSIYLHDRHVSLSDGTLAGSGSNLMDCMKNAVSYGIPLETAVKCCTINPAKKLGLFDRIGSLSIGKSADIVILDKTLNVVKVI